MGKYFHSVTLDEEKCRGCTNCIKRCPTEAIRVRKSKARIINERCIDCGECIRICPYRAKKAISDPFETIFSYKYRVAIPAPALYGQFKSSFTRAHILAALKSLGFDQVYEVARSAEIVSEATRRLIEKGDFPRPLISSACPAVVRLIQVRFPNLIDNILKLESPMEVAAKIIKKEIINKNIASPDDIGVFFITPCAAKVTSVKAPYEKERSAVDGVIAINDIFIKLTKALNTVKPDESLEQAGYEGIRWASSGGESMALGNDRYLAVDGIHNVITILEEVEKDRLEDVDFIEALACVGGCLGGPLTVENAYVAKTRLKKHMEYAKKRHISKRIPFDKYEELVWTSDLKYKPILKLDEDFAAAIKKLERLKMINDELPGLDCGACGAPSCRALAEDIVRGIADETDCIFKLRSRVRALAMQMAELEAKMPPVLDRNIEKKEDDKKNES